MYETKPQNLALYLPTTGAIGTLFLYTIGYSIRSFKTVVNMLLKHEIEKVIDIRFSRYSRNSDFNGQDQNLAMKFLGYGIDYEHRREFGNPNSLWKLFKDNRRAWRLKFFSHFTTGELLLYQSLFTRQKTVLMCSEKKIRHCHRLEVANWLSQGANPEIRVIHL
ncbi:hypothetical protein CEE45_01430 [Candidatus Heimdallarchaeota archaeon B3_Heim]|nr:MAG: hypothetical protein CEE45_01430 [Candidatus Heimdallarchaeota archaeon B3_Heim]